MFYLVLFCSCVFSPFSIAITSLGKDLSTFRTFVRFVLVWFCWFPLPLSVWKRAAVCDCGTIWTFLLCFIFFFLFFFFYI